MTNATTISSPAPVPNGRATAFRCHGVPAYYYNCVSGPVAQCQGGRWRSRRSDPISRQGLYPGNGKPCVKAAG